MEDATSIDCTTCRHPLSEYKRALGMREGIKCLIVECGCPNFTRN